MNELFTAIYLHGIVSPTAFHQVIDGQLDYGQAGPDNVPPYAVFFGFGFDPNDTFDAEIDDGTIQFNCYAADFQTCGDLANKCRARFHGAVLAVTGHENVRLQRELITPPYKTDTEPKTLWQAVVTFYFKMQKL